MRRRGRTQTLNYRAEQSGLLLAAASLPVTFQPTLMPRATMDQALATGLSLVATETVTTLVQETIQAIALVAIGEAARRAGGDVERWSRASLVADAIAVAAGVGVQAALRQRHREPLPRAAARTGGQWLSLAGGAGLLIGGLQEARWAGRWGRRLPESLPVVVPAAGALAAAAEFRRWRREHQDVDLTTTEGQQSAGKALMLGLGVAAAASGVGLGERALADVVSRSLARVLPGNAAVWRPAGHAVSMGILYFAVKTLFQRVLHMIESKEVSVESAFDIPPPTPFVSGCIGSGVPFSTMSKQGRRYVWNVTPPDLIDQVTGETGAMTPIRVYAGLESGEAEEQRVQLIMSELERTGAFDRKWLLVCAPTGTGYVNYAAVSALEVLSRGNCATAAMQYSARPSVLSLDNVNEGRRQTRLLLDTLKARLDELPEERRPRVVLFGESLGAWSSQDAFIGRGTQGLLDRGIDNAIWIGTPHFSEWKEQVLFDDRPDVDDSLLGVFDSIDEWRALPAEQRDAIRYVMITHDNDGVALFGPEIFLQAPEWLGPPETRAARVPKGMRWLPGVTFFQVLVDMKNSANVVPGKFDRTGHDYRADLLPFFDAVLGFDTPPEQMERIQAWLEERELFRSKWIERHGSTGQSMAAVLLTRWLEEGGEEADEELIRRIREVAASDFGAGDGAGAVTLDS